MQLNRKVISIGKSSLCLQKTEERNAESTVKSESLDIDNTVPSTSAEPVIIRSWVVKLQHIDEMVYLVIKSPNGYDRGLVLSKILGATDDTGELCFVVKWDEGDNGDVELVPATIVNEKNPQEVIEYYERRLIINENAQEL